MAIAQPVTDGSGDEVLLEYLSTGERIRFYQGLSTHLGKLSKAIEDKNSAATQEAVEGVKSWMKSWMLTMRLRANSEFQRQSRDYQLRLAANELGEPGGEEELKQVLGL